MLPERSLAQGNMRFFASLSQTKLLHVGEFFLSVHAHSLRSIGNCMPMEGWVSTQTSTRLLLVGRLMTFSLFPRSNVSGFVHCLNCARGPWYSVRGISSSPCRKSVQLDGLKIESSRDYHLSRQHGCIDPASRALSD